MWQNFVGFFSVPFAGITSPLSIIRLIVSCIFCVESSREFIITDCFFGIIHGRIVSVWFSGQKTIIIIRIVFVFCDISLSSFFIVSFFAKNA